MKKLKKGVLESVDLVFEVVFWIALIVLIVAYITQIIHLFYVGLFFLLGSVVVYELHCKKYIKSMLTIYAIQGIVAIAVLYFLRDKLVLLLAFPRGYSLIYLLYGIVLVILGVFLSRMIPDKPKIPKLHISFWFLLFLVPIVLFFGTFYFMSMELLYSLMIAIIVLTLVLLFLLMIFPRHHKKLAPKQVYIPNKHNMYETDFDKLYELVLKRGKVKISTLAKIFKITKNQARERANILEEHHLVHINYPPIGEAEVVKVK